MPHNLRLQNMEVTNIEFMDNDEVIIEITMPQELWSRVCHYLGVNYKGDKLKEKSI